MRPLIEIIDGILQIEKKKIIRSTIRNVETRLTNVLRVLPSLKNANSQNLENAVIEKLQQCHFICDFINFNNVESIDNKTNNLNDLIDYIKNKQNPLNDKITHEIFIMIATNLFRTLPNSNYDPLEDDPILEVGWPHMQLIYDFFLLYIERIPLDNAQKYNINDCTIIQIMELFDSEDPRERDYLKTILHRIYGRFLNLRLIIRKHITCIFLTYLNETHHFNGINELLEVIASIIIGYSTPIKAEHKVFLSRVLMPMHRGELSIYSSQLTYCIVLYLKKDMTLTKTIIHALLRYWPRNYSHKQVIFLREIEEILNIVSPIEFKKIQVSLFKQISNCIGGLHFQIIEFALQLWNNENVRLLFEDNYKILMPIVFPNLYETAKKHWNRTVISLALTVLKLFMETDQKLFKELSEYQRNIKNMEH